VILKYAGYARQDIAYRPIQYMAQPLNETATRHWLLWHCIKQQTKFHFVSPTNEWIQSYKPAMLSAHS